MFDLRWILQHLLHVFAHLGASSILFAANEMCGAHPAKAHSWSPAVLSASETGPPQLVEIMNLAVCQWD